MESCKEINNQRDFLTNCRHTFYSNRSIPVSKLEVMFEAETLVERDKFDEGTDVSTQAPALQRLGGKILRKRHSEKV